MAPPSFERVLDVAQMRQDYGESKICHDLLSDPRAVSEACTILNAAMIRLDKYRLGKPAESFEQKNSATTI